MIPYRNHHYAAIVTDLSHFAEKNNKKRKNFGVVPLDCRQRCVREVGRTWQRSFNLGYLKAPGGLTRHSSHYVHPVM